MCLALLQSCMSASYISIKSSPPNAKVYVVSKWEYEKNLDIFSDTLKLKEKEINEGRTPVVTKVFSKKYKVAVIYNGKTEIRDVDSRKDTANIFIQF